MDVVGTVMSLMAKPIIIKKKVLFDTTCTVPSTVVSASVEITGQWVRSISQSFSSHVMALLVSEPGNVLKCEYQIPKDV